ncbi:uncharacterized protein LOC128161727 [Crassostrea angulata]|uniref:uncharacterized protein LOC128161727 n=1 Tax=Magallana angulata TaxID=2784310 RepID=UPI0022B1B9A0|nr:uncharacterized protein LOC128161727 [Crassostrea angulata]
MRNFEILFVLCFVCSTVSSVNWPDDRFTLVKPWYGCPPGWAQGWTYQDNEDISNKNYITYYHHFYGEKFGRDFKFYYCSKNYRSNTGKRWPPGNYCILRDLSCPSGFSSGSVFWDDEDTFNDNSHGGYLPDGYFGSDTRIDYCCRNDGYYFNAIELPTSHPFYLLRYTSYCQRVKGMHVREEIVRFDDEDLANRNSISGSTPKGAGGHDHFLMYCYYWS